MDEIITFRCPIQQKRFLPIFAFLCLILGIWLISGFRQEFRSYDDSRRWFSVVLFIVCLLIIINCFLKFVIVPFSQITIAPQYIHYKSPVINIRIQWDEILGVYPLSNGDAFRIIGARREIVFNAKNYEESELLLQLANLKLKPIFNRELPSKSEKVLLSLINQILATFPEASYCRIYGKLYSIDHNLKNEKMRIKEIIKSIKNHL
ncbi:MAG: hypothetical protein ABFD79_11390 [Phycisphaerales bacterium]